VRDTDAARRARQREKVLQKKTKKNLLYWYKSAHSAPYLHALLRGAPSVRDTDAAKGVLKEARAGTVLTFTCFTGTKAQNSDAKAHKAFSRRQLP
jgi:hypothetical protein